MAAEPKTSETPDPSRFRLLSLRLDHFRGFVDLRLDFPTDGPAVLIGVNGAGKSAVLDAIGLHLARVAVATSTPMTQFTGLAPTDVRVGSFRAEIEATFDLWQQRRTWALDGRPNANNAIVVDSSGMPQHAIRPTANASVPMLCTYPATRVVNPNDKDQRCERLIRYLADGTMVSDDRQIHNDIDRTLNLNHQGLKRARKGVLDSAISKLTKAETGYWSKADLAAHIAWWKQRSDEGQLREYCQVAIYVLEKKLASRKD
jgi:hypothetical protein